MNDTHEAMLEVKEHFEFYTGDQWKKDDLHLLEKQQRPAITINKVLAVVNLLSGVQRNNRQDFTVLPRKYGARMTAEILSRMLKYSYDNTNGDWKTSAFFDDGTIGGKGWLGVNINYDEDPFNGDIRLEKISPFDMVEDNDNHNYDINEGCKFVIRKYWWKRSELLLKYPDAKKDIEAGGGGNLSEETAFTNDGEEYDDYQYEVFNPNQQRSSEPDDDGGELYYRVIECWWKEETRSKVLINPKTKEFRIVDELTKPIAAKLKESGFIEKERLVKQLRKTVIVGNIELEHDDHPIPGLNKYPFVRYSPYYLENFFFGVIKNLVDPQREHNKRRSQTLHHLSQSANSGIVADDDALSDWSTVEDFGSKPGVIIKKKPGSYFEKIQPTQLSAGHFTLDQTAAQDIKDISGVNTELQGQPNDKAVSGRALLFQQQQGMLVNRIVFDNFNYAMQLLGNLMLDLIRYTDIYEAVDISNVMEDEDMMQLGIIGEDGIPDLSKIPSLRIGNYGVKVVLASDTPTHRMANFNTMLEMAQIGLPIRPKHIIKASDIPNREEVIKDIEIQEQIMMAQAGGVQQPGMPMPSQPSTANGA